MSALSDRNTCWKLEGHAVVFLHRKDWKLNALGYNQLNLDEGVPLHERDGVPDVDVADHGAST